MTVSKDPDNRTLHFPDPPRDIKALLWRMPIWLYRLGLGWMLGNKALLLTHTGGKSGQSRQAVLEIIQAYPSENRSQIVAGFNPGSNWYKNIKAEPRVTIQVGKTKIKAVSVQLENNLAGDPLITYDQKHLGKLKTLSRLIGHEIDHSPAGYQVFGEQIPVIEFTQDPDLGSGD